MTNLRPIKEMLRFKRPCKNCGKTFRPDGRYQRTCPKCLEKHYKRDLKHYKKPLKSFLGGIIFGWFCLIGGLGIGGWVVRLSGWNNNYFYLIISFIYAITLVYKFRNAWWGFWNKPKSI
jgi:hypothetical protein